MVRFNRRNIKGRKPKKKNKFNIMSILILFAAVLVLYYFYYQFEESIMPSVLSMAEFKAKSIATSAINDAINQTIKEYDISSEDLVKYIGDKDGSIISAQINTILINTITADVISQIDKNLDDVGVYHLKVPLGNLTGSDLLANYGPIIEVMILPVGTATIDYDREFRDAGINQINHRIWLDINTNIQIVVPMATEEINIQQKFVLIDHFIKGEVPPNYINVPDTNVLDVAPSGLPD